MEEILKPRIYRNLSACICPEPEEGQAELIGYHPLSVIEPIVLGWRLIVIDMSYHMVVSVKKPRSM